MGCTLLLIVFLVLSVLVVDACVVSVVVVIIIVAIFRRPCWLWLLCLLFATDVPTKTKTYSLD